jgi:molybdenum cofactor cytidylyltransferase
MITCIILSAGESTRFGSPKALALIDQYNVIETIQNKAIPTSVDKIIIVLGHAHERIKPYVFNHKKVHVVYNKNYKFGQTSSLQAGLLGMDPTSEKFILLPVDCPFIKATTIEILCHHLCTTKKILVPTYKNKKGHPPLFDISFRHNILNLSYSEGLNKLLKDSETETIEIDDPGITQTFNTPQELKLLL